MISANRYHDICAGHRVVGHENKCRHLHGHNYRVEFFCSASSLDKVGRIIDFSVIKEKLCMWLEDNWDHKFLMWDKDPWLEPIQAMLHNEDNLLECEDIGIEDSIVAVPFNPTAENMAEYLVRHIGPEQLAGTEVKLMVVNIYETRKCSATYILPNLAIGN